MQRKAGAGRLMHLRLSSVSCREQGKEHGCEGGAWEGAWVRERSCSESVLGSGIYCPSSFYASKNFLSVRGEKGCCFVCP